MEVAKAESNCGASGLVLRLDAIRLDQMPLLSWRWRVDRRLNVVPRYRELFRSQAPPPLGLAIMSDSDDSVRRTKARFAGFKFPDPPELGE